MSWMNSLLRCWDLWCNLCILVWVIRLILYLSVVRLRMVGVLQRKCLIFVVGLQFFLKVKGWVCLNQLDSIGVVDWCCFVVKMKVGVLGLLFRNLQLQFIVKLVLVLLRLIGIVLVLWLRFQMIRIFLVCVCLVILVMLWMWLDLQWIWVSSRIVMFLFRWLMIVLGLIVSD